MAGAESEATSGSGAAESDTSMVCRAGGAPQDAPAALAHAGRRGGRARTAPTRAAAMSG